jgi:hypothetical protein
VAAPFPSAAAEAGLLRRRALWKESEMSGTITIEALEILWRVALLSPI